MIKMRRFTSHILQLKALAISKQIASGLLLLLFLGSCNNEKPDKIGAIVDRTKLPKLHATEVTTIISDSGITRYRITATRWDVFDKSLQPYQEFPDGIYFEKFDPNMKVDANISSKYARFNENEQLWILRGKVRAMNLQGELFETEKLFWNQREQKFYSDTLIKITQSTRIITGMGFESNETMTHYKIKNPQGIFPLNESAKSTAPTSATSTAPPVVTSPVKTPVPLPIAVKPAIKNPAATVKK